MTQDEIIEMANEAELCQCIWVDDEGPEIASLVAFAKLVEAHTRGQIFKPDWDNYRQGLIDGAIAEREACAKVCDEIHAEYEAKDSFSSYAEAIRARGEA
jgi:hypothetical protein